jgi:hypothetical protein
MKLDTEGLAAFALPHAIGSATFPLTLESLRANPVGNTDEYEKPAYRFLNGMGFNLAMYSRLCIGDGETALTTCATTV